MMARQHALYSGWPEREKTQKPFNALYHFNAVGTSTSTNLDVGRHWCNWCDDNGWFICTRAKYWASWTNVIVWAQKPQNRVRTCKFAPLTSGNGPVAQWGWHFGSTEPHFDANENADLVLLWSVASLFWEIYTLDLMRIFFCSPLKFHYQKWKKLSSLVRTVIFEMWPPKIGTWAKDS